MVTVTGAFADEIRTRTDTYLNQVEAATAHLPDAVDAYEDDPDAFVAAVDRLNTRESECDATLRDLSTLPGESLLPNYTDVYLHADDVVRLYGCIDTVPNRSERFARELASMRPSLTSETSHALREMAELVAEGTALLTDLAVVYVESLVTSGDQIAVVDDVETIVALESACDAHKYDALQSVFAHRETADAVAVRELLLALDAAMDATNVNQIIKVADDKVLFIGFVGDEVAVAVFERGIFPHLPGTVAEFREYLQSRDIEFISLEM